MMAIKNNCECCYGQIPIIDESLRNEKHPPTSS